MGLMDFIKSQLIEIIEWTDDSRDTLSYRWPDEDKEIKRGAQLIVRESQTVQFVYLGQFGDAFGPGKHDADHRQHSRPVQAQGLEVRVRIALQGRRLLRRHAAVHRQQVGHVEPGDGARPGFRDRARCARSAPTTSASSTSPRFLKEVAGTDQHFRLDEFADTMRSRLVSVFSDALASSKVPALDIATRYSELGEALLPLINPVITEKYGLEMTSFILENVSVPPEVEAAIDKRSGMAAVGNLNDFVKYQMAQGFEKGGPGAAGLGAEMAVGIAMAQADAESARRHRRPVHAAGRRRRPAPGRIARDVEPGRRGQAPRRQRSRRDRQPRSGRPEGQAHRHAVAHHAGAARAVPAVTLQTTTVTAAARAR